MEHSLSNRLEDSGALPPTPITVGASAFTYRNTLPRVVAVFVSGGTVSTIEWSADQVTWITAGLVAGQYILGPGDSLRVTYAVAPTMTLAPL